MAGFEVTTEGEIFGIALWQRCIERLAADLGFIDQASAGSLEDLLPYLDFSDPYNVLNAHNALLTPTIGRYVKQVTPTLEKLAPIRKRVMHSRPLNFDDLAMALDAAEEFVKNNGEGIWVTLSSTIERLRIEPSFVLGLEIPVYGSERNNQKHNLPTPDFDETGFLGRQRQVDELIRVCLGPFPVITIVGEGGIGKTALALKVAYEILDYPDCAFEAIVWTTSKTTTLTAQEIVKIEGAICDSLGMFQSAANALAGVEAKNPLEEVLDYLAEFRILLIMDNLETVMDDRIRGFLQRLPIGSKVLITSRIGLGSFEYPVKLQALDEGDAIQLLRALAKARGVPQLVTVDNRQLGSYCHRMKNNPGYIKWFVSAVQTGRRPEDVLSNPTMFLEFCMSNVYSFLSEGSRRVLRSMLCLPGRRNQAELAYLNEIEAIELQKALQELLTTNMVTMSTVPSGSSFESYYDLSELARAYLLKQHPIESDELKRLSLRRQKLTAVSEQMQADLGSDPYSFFSVRIRSRSDLIVVRYLKDALTEARRKRFEVAENLVEKARRLAPDYYEVHRVDAQIQAMQNNNAAALTCYEAAIELEPKSAPLRKWFGSFLMRFMDDTESALEQFRLAAQTDPASVEVQLEFASAHLYTRMFDEAEALLKALLRREDVAAWHRTKVNDLQLQFFQRKAEYLDAHHDYAGALDCLKGLRRFYRACNPAHIDLRMKTKFQKAIPTARSCSWHIGDAALRAQAQELLDWLQLQVKWTAQTSRGSEGRTLFGRIAKLQPHREYGFVESDEGAELFFHFSKLVKQEEISNLEVGARISFVMGANSAGPCAVRVSLLEKST